MLCQADCTRRLRKRVARMKHKREQATVIRLVERDEWKEIGTAQDVL